MLANEQIIVSFGSSLTLPMCIASIWNINGKLQTHRGQVIATKHHLDKIGAVPTNLTYGGNVVDYIIPHEFFYMVGSTIKLASTIPIKEDNYDATNVKYGILLHFCSWSKYICNPKHALWQLEPPPTLIVVTCQWWTPSPSLSPISPWASPYVSIYGWLKTFNPFACPPHYDEVDHRW